MRISLMRAAVVVLACVASLTPALAGTAAAKCQPGRVNNGSAYFAGWSRNSSTVGGVYSLILNYSPWVQPNSQVTAWTMLTLSNNNTKWAQVGWWEEAGGVRHTFTQYTDNSTWHTLFLSPKAVGTSTYYTTLYDAGTHKFTFQVAGSTVQTVTAVFAPNASQIMGEIDTLASQMPGGLNAKEIYDDSHIWTTAWVSYDGTSTGNQTLWNSTKVSTLKDTTYDKACQS